MNEVLTSFKTKSEPGESREISFSAKSIAARRYERYGKSETREKKITFVG